MFRRSRHTAAPTRLPDDQFRIAWQACSLLLDYPSEALSRGWNSCGERPVTCRHTSRSRYAAGRPPGKHPAGAGCSVTSSRPSTTPGAAVSTSPTSPPATPASVGWPSCGSSRPTAGRVLELTSGELPDHLALCWSSARQPTSRRPGGSSTTIARASRCCESRCRRSILRGLTRRAISRTLPELAGDDAEAIAKLIELGPLRGRRPGALRRGPAAQSPARLSRRWSRPMTTFLWVIFPYLCLTTFVVGHYWRYRYDKFGWTTRSSQLYEDRLLRIGSPLFHFGMLGVLGGHIIGLVIPQVWTDALGLSRHTYHVIALAAGIPAGIAAVVGAAHPRLPPPDDRPGLQRDDEQRQGHVCRARRGHRCWASGTPSPGRGCSSAATTTTATGCRPTSAASSPSSPRPSSWRQAPLGFQAARAGAFLLFAMWPFTRLVHVFSAPIGYLTRPYIVYRSRDVRPGAGVGTRAPNPGWERSAR
jgi:nitrate reductase gamma subunit